MIDLLETVLIEALIATWLSNVPTTAARNLLGPFVFPQESKLVAEGFSTSHILVQFLFSLEFSP